MPFELQVIVWTTLILFALLMFQGGLVPVNQGLGWGLGSRDAKREFTALQNRTTRTIANHIEGMLIFVPLVLVLHVMDISSTLTVWGAGLFLLGRALFAPIYLIGVPYLRSTVWAISLVGIMLIGYQVLIVAI